MSTQATNDSQHGERAATVFGIEGRTFFYFPAKGPARQQRFVSSKPIDWHGKEATLKVELRFDDECGNGHQTFAMTGDVRLPRRPDIETGGCIHDLLAKHFPTMAHLIPWHLCSTDGPMHYVANTVYMASDRDHWGLLKGEFRQGMSKDGRLAWELRRADGKGLGYDETHIHATVVPPAPRLEWVASGRVGEGKERELDKARNAACWPDATDAELMAEPATLRAALAARLPALLARFRADMESCGFEWRVAELTDADRAVAQDPRA